MTDSINTLTPPTPMPQIEFTFSPTAEAYTYLVDETVYPSNGPTFYWADVDTAITFTATAIYHDSVNYTTEWRWDFGDGTIGYGNPVDHTYAMPNNTGQVVLRVTDRIGHYTYARAPMYVKV